MKLSVSLPEDDVAYLDTYAERQGLDSRSAALQKAVRLLRTSELAAAYEDAWVAWDASEDGQLWDAIATEVLD